MNFIRFFLIIYNLSPVLFFINLASVGLVAVLDTATILAVAPIIDHIANTSTAESGICQKLTQFLEYFSITPSFKIYIVTFIVLMTLKSLAGFLYRYISLRTKYFFIKKMMTDAFNHFLEGGMSFFNSEKQGVLLNTINSEVTTVGNSLSTMSVFLSNLIHIVFYFMVPLAISWELTLISAIAFLIIVLPSKIIDLASYKKGQENVRTANNVTIKLQESLSAIKVILAFGNKDHASTEYADTFEKHRKAAISFQLIGHLITAIFEPLLMIVLFGILYFAQSRYKIPLSEVIIILYTFKMMMPIIISTIKDKNNIVGFIPSYEQIKKLTGKALTMKIPDGKEEFQTLTEGIEFRNVSFSYHKQSILNKINFKIKKGNKVAFVGKSGAGKTTIVDLVLGLYQIESGQILLDNKSLDQFKLDTFRKKIGYVPQDPVLFNSSLRENLLWAVQDKDKVTDDEIKSSLKKSNSLGFFSNMPQGLDTLMGERGAKLSGGERQRIALSRALIRKPELLILDEATSALDNSSEQLIQDAVDNLGQHTTVIVIAHRLSTIKKVDQIFYVENGVVVESGTYDELISKKGQFSSLAQSLN